MSEENSMPTEAQDPLSGAASGWEAPKFPVLAADRVCDFEIVKSVVDTLKEDKDKSNPRKQLVLTLKTTKDYSDKEGKPLRAGFTCFKRVGLYEVRDDPKGRRDRLFKEHIGPELAQVLQCCGMGNREPRDLRDHPEIIVKSIVAMRTSIVPPKDGFPESNNLNFVPPA